MSESASVTGSASSRKRLVWVHVKATEDERSKWQTTAAERKLTLSDLIRQSLDAEPVGRPRREARAKVVRADPDLVNAIVRLGNNLNQLARWTNKYKSAASSIQILAALMAIERALLTLQLASVSVDPAGRD